MIGILRQFNQFSLRTRWSMFGLSALLLFWIWWEVCYLPLSHCVAQARQEKQAAAETLRVLKADYAVYERFLHTTPAETTAQISALKRERGNLEKNILLSKRNWTKAESLQVLLQGIAKAPAGIVIQQLEVLQPPPNTENAQQKILLKFRGDFFSTLAYLEYLERLPWFLVYDEVRYVVKQYPDAEVSVIVTPV